MIKEIKKIIGKPEKEAVEILEKHNYYKDTQRGWKKLYGRLHV